MHTPIIHDFLGMNFSYFHLLSFVFVFGFYACTDGAKTTATTPKNLVGESAGLQVDHLNIWVEDYERAKMRLQEIGFTAIPDSLSAVHEGQGTAGRYFLFLDSYLELIFVHDQQEL